MNLQSLIGPALGIGMTAASGGAANPYAPIIAGAANSLAQGGSPRDALIGAGIGAVNSGMQTAPQPGPQTMDWQGMLSNAGEAMQGMQMPPQSQPMTLRQLISGGQSSGPRY